MNDVARLAGVSATTAKRAIREPQLLSSGTLTRANLAIEELLRELKLFASALRGGHTKAVGVMIGDSLEPFVAELTETVGCEVRACGYTRLLADNEYDAQVELRNLRQVHGSRVSGIVLRSSHVPMESNDDGNVPQRSTGAGKDVA